MNLIKAQPKRFLRRRVGNGGLNLDSCARGPQSPAEAILDGAYVVLRAHEASGSGLRF
jgi:hypothetical protein